MKLNRILKSSVIGAVSLLALYSVNSSAAPVIDECPAGIVHGSNVELIGTALIRTLTVSCDTDLEIEDNFTDKETMILPGGEPREYRIV